MEGFKIKPKPMKLQPLSNFEIFDTYINNCN